MFCRDGRLVEGDKIVAINGESILDNEGGPEAMQQVRIEVYLSILFKNANEFL